MNHRLKAAAELIRKTGMKVSKAMRAVGYSEATIRSGNPTHRTLRHAQEHFVNRFANNAEKIGLTPERTTRTLEQIEREGTNFERLGAVKEYHQVILKSQALALISARNGKSSPSINLNFILPASNAHATDESWKAAAIEAQTAERENERAMVASQQNERNPVRARTHNLRGQAFKDAMPESWHANRSATIRKAWDRRGRLSAEGRAKAAKKAEAMGLKAGLARPSGSRPRVKDGMEIAKAKNKGRRTK